MVQRAASAASHLQGPVRTVTLQLDHLLSLVVTVNTTGGPDRNAIFGPASPHRLSIARWLFCRRQDLSGVGGIGGSHFDTDARSITGSQRTALGVIDQYSLDPVSPQLGLGDVGLAEVGEGGHHHWFGVLPGLAVGHPASVPATGHDGGPRPGPPVMHHLQRGTCRYRHLRRKGTHVSTTAKDDTRIWVLRVAQGQPPSRPSP